MSEEKKDSSKIISNELLEYSRDLFDHYTSDYDTIDNKSLGVIGIAGLLVGLGALNADTLAELIKKLSYGQCVDILSMVAIGFHLIFLVACIINALSAFQVKEIDYPNGLCELPYKSVEQQKIAIFGSFSKSVENIEKLNLQKAEKLRQSVNCITISIFSLILFVLLAVIDKCK